MSYIRITHWFTRSKLERVLLDAGQFAHVSTAKISDLLRLIEQGPFPVCLHEGHEISELDVGGYQYFNEREKFYRARPIFLLVQAHFGSLCHICGDNTASLWGYRTLMGRYTHIGMNDKPSDNCYRYCGYCFGLLRYCRSDFDDVLQLTAALRRRDSELLKRIRKSSRLVYRFDPRPRDCAEPCHADVLLEKASP